jgi:hypothetical protein
LRGHGDCYDYLVQLKNAKEDIRDGKNGMCTTAGQYRDAKTLKTGMLSTLG